MDTGRADYLERGVFIAPWRGPNDEIVLFKRDRRQRLVGELRMIRPGENSVLIGDQMGEELDADPELPLTLVR